MVRVGGILSLLAVLAPALCARVSPWRFFIPVPLQCFLLQREERDIELAEIGFVSSSVSFSANSG